MNSISIENLYSNLDRHIKLVASYTELPSLAFIIKSIRLKPYSLIFEKYHERLILHKWWIDEYGNSLILNKKKPEIILNDLKIDKSKLTSTDLYGHLSIDKVAKISKLVYFFSGKEEDFYSDHMILSFLGIDGFLRTFIYLYGEWIIYPSLLLGVKALSSVASNIDIQSFIEIKNKKNILYPCIKQRAWIGYWPPNREFFNIIKEQNDFVLDVLQVK